MCPIKLALSSSPSKLSRSLLLHIRSMFSVYLEAFCSPSTLKLFVLHLSIVSSKLEHPFRRTRALSQLSASSPSPPYLGMFRLILYKYLIAFMYRTLSEVNMARVSHI